MKCERCGYDDHGTGSAHACSMINGPITVLPPIAIGIDKDRRIAELEQTIKNKDWARRTLIEQRDIQKARIMELEAQRAAPVARPEGMCTVSYNHDARQVTLGFHTVEQMKVFKNRMLDAAPVAAQGPRKADPWLAEMFGPGEAAPAPSERQPDDVKFDLLEALQELTSEYRKALEELFEPQHHRFIETNTALKMARAAIAKATAESEKRYPLLAAACPACLGGVTDLAGHPCRFPSCKGK